jgi:hypothetical protein
VKIMDLQIFRQLLEGLDGKDDEGFESSPPF